MWHSQFKFRIVPGVRAGPKMADVGNTHTHTHARMEIIYLENKMLIEEKI